jgi:hypothetical protein
MKMIEAKTCFKFVPKTSAHADYLLFKPEESCHSVVGRLGKNLLKISESFDLGGEQIISLFGWCSDPAPAIHDIMHALGKLDFSNGVKISEFFV